MAGVEPLPTNWLSEDGTTLRVEPNANPKAALRGAEEKLNCRGWLLYPFSGWRGYPGHGWQNNAFDSKRCRRQNTVIAHVLTSA